MRIDGDYGTSIESVREIAEGLLDGYLANPGVQLRTAMAQWMPDRPDVYAITEMDDRGDVRIIINGYWLARGRRDELVSGFLADGQLGRPAGLSALMRRQLSSPPPRAGVYLVGRASSSPRGSTANSVSPNGPYTNRGPLAHLETIKSARSVEGVGHSLRAALQELLGRDITVELGSSARTDLDAAKSMGIGLVEELLSGHSLGRAPGSGLSHIEIGALPASYAHTDAYAVSAPRADGTHQIIFNDSWFGLGRGEHLRESLARDSAASPDAPADAAALAARHAVGSPTRVSASPRGELSPTALLGMIRRSDRLRDIERHLAEALRGALGYAVPVELGSDTRVEAAREIADGLIRTALADPKPEHRLAGVRVTDLAADEGDQLAVTRLGPDRSHSIEFNRKYHQVGAAELCRDNLAKTRSVRVPPPRDLSELAALRMRVPGTGLLTPEQYQGLIARAPSLSDVEQHLRNALRATLGRTVYVDLHSYGRYSTSLDSARDIASGLITASSELPGAEIDAVTMGALATNVYAHAVREPGRGTTLVFSQKWHSHENRQTYLQAVQENYASGFHPGSTPAEVAIHEYGHAVSLAMPRWMEAGSVPGHEASLEDEVRQRSGLLKAEWSSVASQVSRYAKKNNEELTAEAFVEVLRKGLRASGEISRTVFQRLRDAHIDHVHRTHGPAFGLAHGLAHDLDHGADRSVSRRGGPGRWQASTLTRQVLQATAAGFRDLRDLASNRYAHHHGSETEVDPGTRGIASDRDSSASAGHRAREPVALSLESTRQMRL